MTNRNSAAIGLRGTMGARLVSLAATAIAVIGLAGCASAGSEGGAGSDEDVTNLSVAVVGITQDAALQLAIDKGMFEQRGLHVTPTVVANPAASLAAVQGGQVEFAYAPSIPVLNALSQSVPVQIVAGADANGNLDNEDPAKQDDTAIVVNPASGITTLTQLEGKTISVPARNAQLEVTIAAALKDAGADPTTINWVVLDFASAVEAVKGGTVDAAGLVNPFFAEAIDAGMTLLASPGVAFFNEGAVGLWVTGAQFAAEDPETVAEFREAMYEAQAYANDHPDEAIEVGRQLTGVTVPVEELTPVLWVTEVRLSDVSHVNGRLVELGYLTEPVDLSNAFVDGALAAEATP